MATIDSPATPTSGQSAPATPNLPLQNTYQAPNDSFVQQLTFQTTIQPDGTLRIAAVVVQQAAYCDPATGKWSCPGATGKTQIIDINKLPADLASLASGIAAAVPAVMSLVAAVNAIRKMV